jgi:O-antigen ligase
VAFPDVLTLGTHESKQVSQGAVFLPIAVAGTTVAGVALGLLLRRAGPAAEARRLPAWRAALAIAVVPLVLGAGIAVSAHGKETTDVPTGAARIVHAETNRGHYWRVAFDTFGRHPLNGVGSGSFVAEWRRLRGHDQFALDAHSIYFETLAELGIVGGLMLLAFAATLVTAVVRTFRSGARDATSAAAAAVLAAFAVHAGLDWDWEMPAVTLVALILAAAILQPLARRRDEGAWAP